MKKFEAEKFQGLRPICAGCFEVTYAYVGLIFLSTLELILCLISGHTFGLLFVGIGYFISIIGLYLGITWGDWSGPGVRAGFYDRSSKRYAITRFVNTVAVCFAAHMMILVFVRCLYSTSRMGNGMPDLCIKSIGCSRVGSRPNRCGAIIKNNYTDPMELMMDKMSGNAGDCAIPRAKVPLKEMQNLAVEYIENYAVMGSVIRREEDFVWGLSVSRGMGFPDDIAVYTFCEPGGEYAQAWIQMECRAGVGDFNKNDFRLKDMTDYMISRLPNFENEHNITFSEKWQNEKKIEEGRCDSDPDFTYINPDANEASIESAPLLVNDCPFPYLDLKAVPGVKVENGTLKPGKCDNTYAEVFPEHYSALKTFYWICSVPVLLLGIFQLYLLWGSLMPIALLDVQKHGAIWGLSSGIALTILSFDPNGFAGGIPILLAEWIKQFAICSLLTNVIISMFYWYTLADATHKMRRITVTKRQFMTRTGVIVFCWILFFTLRTMIVISGQANPNQKPGLRGMPVLYDVMDFALVTIVMTLANNLSGYIAKMRKSLEKKFEDEAREAFNSNKLGGSSSTDRKERKKNKVLSKVYSVSRYNALEFFLIVCVTSKMMSDSAPGESEMVYLQAGTFAFPLTISFSSIMCMLVFFVSKKAKSESVGTSYAGTTKKSQVAPSQAAVQSEAPK